MLDNFGVGPANTIIQYFNGQDNQFFVPFAASLFPFLRPAYHKLVNMDSPVNGVFQAARHRLLYFPFERPACFLAQLELPAQFQRGHALFLGANFEGNMEGDQNRELKLFKQSPHRGAFVIITSRAPSVVGLFTFGKFFVPTSFAFISTIPFNIAQIDQAIIIIPEPLVELYGIHSPEHLFICHSTKLNHRYLNAYTYTSILHLTLPTIYLKNKSNFSDLEIFEKNNQDKYDAFKSKVLSNISAFCNNRDQIKTETLKSISNFEKNNSDNMSGWISADGSEIKLN